MGKNSAGADRRARMEAMRAEQDRKQRQAKLLVFTAIGVVLVLVAVGIAIAIAHAQSQANARKAADRAKATAFIPKIENIPASEFDKVGIGAANYFNTKMTGPAITKNGLPQVIYYGAEFCPYCGMERWALVAGLSRFGTFSGLGSTVSSPSDSVKNIPTVTFHGSTFTSKYLTFTPYEVQDQTGGQLETVPAADQKYWDQVNKGSYPTLVWGGKAATTSPNFDGSEFMQNVSADSVAAQLSDASSPAAQGIIGAANVVSAQVCTLTGQQPANVCNSAGVKAAAAKLPAGS